MRIKTFLLANIIFLSLLSSISYAVPVPCDSCLVSSCQCTITDCSSGTLDVYSTPDCTLIPTYSFKFSDGTVTWSPSSTGSYYLRVLCDDGSISSCTELHFIGIPPTTTPSGNGGGGGGGGGTLVDKNHEKTQIWTQITPGAAAIMKVTDPEIGLKQIEITVNNPANNVKITVTKIESEPASVVYAITSKVYKYVEITAEKIDETHIDKVKIQFEVNKSWIDDNKIDSDTVFLNRYEDGWEKLPTQKTDEDDDFIYYEAEATGFSTYAISGDLKAEATTTTVPITTTPTCISTGNSCASNSDCCSGYCCDNVCSDKECEVDKGFRTYYIILIVIIVSVSIIGYLFFTKYWKRTVPKEVEDSVYTESGIQTT